MFFPLLQVKQADCLAQAPGQEERIKQLNQLREIGERIVQEGQCLSRKELAVTGKDLQKIGIMPGIGMGQTLEWLLHEVIDGELPNERQALLTACLQQGRAREHQKNN